MPDYPVSVISAPLQKRIENDKTALQRIVIELGKSPASLTYAAAVRRIKVLIRELLETAQRTEQHVLSDGDEIHPYLKARLQGSVILDLVNRDQNDPRGALCSAVYLDADDKRYFNPDTLIRTVISLPLLTQIESDENATQDVQIELNYFCEDGLPEAKKQLQKLIDTAIAESEGHIPRDEANAGTAQEISDWKTEMSEQYVYATLAGWSIRRLVELDHEQHNQKRDQAKGKAAPPTSQGPGSKKELEKTSDFHTIYHIWPDFKLRAQIWRSVSTVKADACRRSFATTGKGVVWAIFDSGIAPHPQFTRHKNLELPSGLRHMDFLQRNPASIESHQLTDDYGHGTHVAGIIAGELDAENYRAISLSRERDQAGRISFKQEVVTAPILGVAPECSLLSYKVLDKNGEGNVSTVIAAIQKVQQLNGYGRNLVIHGVNMSLGYDFDPEWFAVRPKPYLRGSRSPGSIRGCGCNCGREHRKRFCANHQ